MRATRPPSCSNSSSTPRDARLYRAFAICGRKEKARLTGRDLEAYQSFLDETERALVKIEFNPAEIGGCPVRQLVQMPFTFALRR